MLTAQLLNVPAWPEVSNSTVDISLQGALDALTASVTSEGNVVMQSLGHINLTHQRLPFDLKLSADKLPLPLSLTKYGQPAILTFDVVGDLMTQTVDLSSSFTSDLYKDAQLKLSAKHHQGLITLNKFIFNDNTLKFHMKP